MENGKIKCDCPPNTEVRTSVTRIEETQEFFRDRHISTCKVCNKEVHNYVCKMTKRND